jgi:AcrR family transcriptional regulator
MTRAPGTARERRERLLEAGMEAFGTTPYDDVRVADIAARAGVAAGLPFHYFGSKRGYYLEVVSHISVLMLDVLAVPAGTSPSVAARAILNANLEWLSSHPFPLRELMRGQDGSDIDIRQIFDQTRQDGVRHLLSSIGLTHELDAATQLMVAGWAVMKNDLLLRWIEDPVVSRDTLVESIVGVLADILQRSPDPKVSACGGEIARRPTD